MVKSIILLIPLSSYKWRSVSVQMHCGAVQSKIMKIVSLSKYRTNTWLYVYSINSIKRLEVVCDMHLRQKHTVYSTVYV